MRHFASGPALGAALVLAVALAPAALAQGPAQGAPPGWLVLYILPILAVPIHLLVAALGPSFAKRLYRAVASRTEANVGWGVLTVVLVGLVALVLGAIGGTVGRGLAGLVLTLVYVCAMVGMTGIALAVGRWSLRRDGVQTPPTFTMVAAGATIVTFAALVPCIGWLLWLVLTVLALGALARCTFGVPSVPAEPGSEPMPSGSADVAHVEGAEA